MVLCEVYYIIANKKKPDFSDFNIKRLCEPWQRL